MKIAAKPAVSSSDAGISAINSRLRALTARCCPASSRLHEALGVVLGAQLVVGEGRAARGGHALERHARVPDRRVEPDPEREVVRKAVVEGDDVAAGFVDADEVDLARREPEGGQEADDAAEREQRPGVTSRRRRRRGALGAEARAAWPSSIGCARGRTADSATVPEARYSASASSLAPAAPRPAASSRRRVWPCGRLTPWRGSATASPGERVVLARVLVERRAAAVGAAGGARAARRPPRA